jgi:hypothetical protein
VVEVLVARLLVVVEEQNFHDQVLGVDGHQIFICRGVG